jgi:uncharacterized phage protein gp47/JayE
MAVDIPKTIEIIERIIADYNSELSQTIPDLEKATFKVQAQSYGGAIWHAYKAIQGVGLDILPTTARKELLDSFGIILNLPRQAAVATELEATATGDNTEVILAGKTYKSTDNNVVYVNLANETIAGGVATLELRALEGGTLGNLTVSDELTAVTPQANVSSTVTVSAITTEGVDKETDEAYRQRLIDRFRLRPQGGAKIDYIIWAQLVSGVTRVFPFTQPGGIVDVYFLRDNDVNRIPDANEILDVENKIDEAYKRPAAATVVVKAPSDQGFTVDIAGFTGTPAEETEAEDAILAYFLARQPYVSGVDLDETKSKVLQADIIVLTALVASFTSVTLYKDTAPATPITTYTLLENEVASGAVNFV